MKRGHSSKKEYNLVHQILCVTSVDFKRQTLQGFVELHIQPLVPVLSRIKVNCRQCRICRVCIKGQGLESWLEAAFLTEDPGTNVGIDSRKRNLDYFYSNLHNAVCQTEPENGGGEITVRLPSETMPLVEEKKILRVSIEFVLDKPSSGIHFCIPSGEGTLAEKNCHMFSYKWGNSSRLWFPCIDSLSEICTWKIEVTADPDMVVVCPGDLAEKILTQDEKRVTHHFTLTTPTSACNIGIAVGPFEVVSDPEMSDVTYFVLPGLKPLVKNTTSFLSEAFEYFEEALNTQYPHSTFKLVFVDEAYEMSQAFQSFAIFNTKLLHPPFIIEQPFVTRKYLIECLAEQFFGMFVSIQSWADLWLIRGISLYLTGLFVKKMFGNNEYRFWLMTEMQSLCTYELDGPTLAPLYPFPLTQVPLDGKHEYSNSNNSSRNNEIKQDSILRQHPHLISSEQLKMLETKSHLIMRMIELRIGQDLLMQTFNKILSLATTAAARRSDSSNWHSMLLSTTGFLKTISTVSGKDINVFVDQWIFNRKRNIIELEMTQYSGKGCQKYVGPLIVCVQELDGSFSHTVQVEDTVSHHEIPCHSKSRRNKKKKIPLITGEEVDMDLSATFDTDSPVLWVRVDPDMTWARRVSIEQPDYMWQYQLRYERNVTSQIEAVEALQKYPCSGTRNALIDIIKQNEAFYRVRTESTHSLAKVLIAESEVSDNRMELIEIFEKMFGSKACASVPRYNDFRNFVKYFIQKSIPAALANQRHGSTQCQSFIIKFILNLLKYNDNRFNHYSDGEYVASLIQALGKTIGPAFQVASTVEPSMRKTLPANEEARAVLSEVNRRLNMEKILSSYKYIVTCSCLKAIRHLQVTGHIPAESALFRKYSRYGLFEDIRLTALEILVDFVQVNTSEKDLEWLLDLVETDPVPRIKHHIMACLTKKPPFEKKSSESLFNNLTLVERLWQMMNSDCTLEYRLRCSIMEFYSVLWGKVTPPCVPSHGFAMVIDLKEKKAMSNIGAPNVPASPEIISVSAGEDGVWAKKRRLSVELDDHNIMDSFPGTPMSICSESSATAKIKLKIKLASEDTSHDSGSDLFPTAKSNDPLSLLDGGDEDTTTNTAKKVKKKKKKKHKHKDKNKEQNKTASNKLDFSNTNIPGVHRALLDDRLAAHHHHQQNSPLSQSLSRTESEMNKLDNVTEMMMDDSDELSDM